MTSVRALAAVLLAIDLPLGQAVAPTHAHEDADHHVVQVHQHIAGHHGTAAHHEPATFDHADGTVIWLANAALHKTVANFSPVEVLVAVEVNADVALERDGLSPFDDAVPAHGPPGTIRSHRGPPSFSPEFS